MGFKLFTAIKERKIVRLLLWLHFRGNSLAIDASLSSMAMTDWFQGFEVINTLLVLRERELEKISRNFFKIFFRILV